MPSRKLTTRRQQRVVKRRRLLEGVVVPPRKKSKESTVTPIMTTPVLIDLLTDGSQNQSTDETAPAVTSSSSMLKRYEGEMSKDQKSSSPDPTLSRQRTVVERQLLNVPPQSASANSPFFYSPMYRRYFGFTPPNPRLYNPRLIEDYVDWYMNVYLEEELPWHSLDIGTAAERAQKSEEEAREEVEKLASAPTTISKGKS